MTGATSTTYLYDYANRLTALGTTGSATTTYGYDAFGNRVSQITGGTSIFYPNKFYSITTTGTGTTTATSTEYVFSGDRLLATKDQLLIGGVATGSSTTRYIHPDNLGSTNVTSDPGQNQASWFDYAPYGSILASTNTGTTTTARQWIGQFADASGLSYLNARYYSPTQGQFLTQDPVFLGDPKQQNLADPQSLNVYSYSEDNPITNKDPSGRQVDAAFDVASEITSSAPSWGPTINSALSSWAGPILAGIGTSIIANNGWSNQAQKAQNYNNNRTGGFRYVPFSEQGRVVQPPGVPDPFDPWDNWKPGNPNDWKTWVGTGLGLIGAATDIYQSAKDLPSNNRQTINFSSWAPLPTIVIQGSSSYYRNSSGLLTLTPRTAGQAGTRGSNTQSVPGNLHSACGALCR